MLIDKDNDMNINHNRNNISMRFKDFLKDFLEYGTTFCSHRVWQVVN